MEAKSAESHEVELNMLLTESYSNFWMFDRAACWRLRLTKRRSPTCRKPRAFD